MSTFEIVRGVEGDCLVLDNTRICGPKPWGGGRIIKTFHTDGIYEVIYKDEYRKLMAENAKLRDALKALMMGTNAELCVDRDASQCQECSMALDEHRCAMSDAMLLLGIDMYGEPLGGE